MYEALFSFANLSVLPAWLMLAVAPGSVWTRRLVNSGAWSLLYAVAYAVLLAAIFARGEGGALSTLAAVRHAFGQPSIALLGWVHYLAFDLLAGARITEEGSEAGCSRWFMAPFLFLTLMFGPVGFLLWRGARGMRRSVRGRAPEPA